MKRLQLYVITLSSSLEGLQGYAHSKRERPQQGDSSSCTVSFPHQVQALVPSLSTSAASSSMYGSCLTRSSESLRPASSSVPGSLSLGPAASFRSKSRMIRKLSIPVSFSQLNRPGNSYCNYARPELYEAEYGQARSGNSIVGTPTHSLDLLTHMGWLGREMIQPRWFANEFLLDLISQVKKGIRSQLSQKLQNRGCPQTIQSCSFF